MAIDRTKAFEIDENGLTIEGGANITSSGSVPTHTGAEGDRHLHTNGSEYIYQSGVWTLQTTSGFNEDTILTDNFYDVLVDSEGNVLRSA